MNDPYLPILIAHVLGASIWTGGHLILAVVYLPAVLARRDVALFEAIGMPALLLQIATGVWLAGHLIGWGDGWLDASSPATRAIWVKLALLAATAALALNARLRVIPRLDARTLPVMAAHIVTVTLLSVIFVVVGVLAGRGGL